MGNHLLEYPVRSFSADRLVQLGIGKINSVGILNDVASHRSSAGVALHSVFVIDPGIDHQSALSAQLAFVAADSLGNQFGKRQILNSLREAKIADNIFFDTDSFKIQYLLNGHRVSSVHLICKTVCKNLPPLLLEVNPKKKSRVATVSYEKRFSI
jgi:hypothetical protein